jgi:hypothetical protein
MLRVAGRLGQCFPSVSGKCDMVRPSAAVRIELPERVTGGKTLSEYMFSELPQTADIVATSPQNMFYKIKRCRRVAPLRDELPDFIQLSWNAIAAF